VKVTRLVLAFLLLVTLAFAQQPMATAQQAYATGVSWFQSAWKRVQKEGRPAAERLIRSAPKRFKLVESNVADLNRKANRWVADRNLDQKKTLLLEMWRLRGSLNLMALVSPENLETLTGVSAKELRGMQVQLTRVQRLLATEP